MGYHVNIMQCMQPNFLDRKSTLFELVINFFLKGVVFMFWHDIAYIELLYCVTNFEFVWT